MKIATIVIIVAIGLVTIECILAYIDGYFSSGQITKMHGISNGYAITQHAGVWTDLFVLPPLFWYFTNKYDFNFMDWRGWTILAVAIILIGIAGGIFGKGINPPEAFAHDGKTPPAGWVHGLYALMAFWLIVEIYFGKLTPRISMHDLIVASVVLTFFFFIGIQKFSSRWHWDKTSIGIVVIETSAVWLVTGIRFVFY